MNNSVTPTATPCSYLRVATSAAGRSTLEANILSVIPAAYAIPSAHKRVRLGVVAVEICNLRTNEIKSIYAFHDTGLQMTRLRKSVAEEIGLHGKPYIQPCRGLHVAAEFLAGPQTCGK